MESGYNFTLASQAILAKDMVRVVHSRNDTLTITPAALSVKLTGYENLPYNIKFVTIVGSTAMSKASFWLTSCSAGAEVYLRVVGDITGGWTNNNTSVYVSMSGCMLIGSVGDQLSSIELHTSAASDAMLHLIAPIDNVWAIIEQYGTPTVENAL